MRRVPGHCLVEENPQYHKVQWRFIGGDRSREPNERVCSEDRTMEDASDIRARTTLEVSELTVHNRLCTARFLTMKDAPHPDIVLERAPISCSAKLLEHLSICLEMYDMCDQPLSCYDRMFGSSRGDD